MNVIRKYTIPNLCISFTLVVLYSSIWNIIEGNDSSGFHKFILEYGAVLLLVGIVDHFIGRCNFKSYLLQSGIVWGVNYVIFMTASYFLRWFGFRLENILNITLLCIAIYGLLVLYNYKLYKQEENMINKLINQRNSQLSGDL